MKRKLSRGLIAGETTDTGFQIGVRRTLPISLEQAWKLIASREGIKLWLGDVKDFRLATGQAYQTRDGARGEVRVVNPHENIRLTWQPPEWQRASTIQARVIPGGREKTVVSFHQEQLPGEVEREQMRQRWGKVLDKVQGLIRQCDQLH